MKRLMRAWYRTDAATNADPADAEYVGTFSDPFNTNPTWQIVDVDWSPPGEVQVTYLIPADHL
jgi:hypothetical protein